MAQQILSILSALAAGLTRFYLRALEINLVWSCGIFITMNPGKSLGVEQMGLLGANVCASFLSPTPGQCI